MPLNLTITQEAVLAAVTHEVKTARTISEACGIGQSVVSNTLETLRNKGSVERSGWTRPTMWRRLIA